MLEKYIREIGECSRCGICRHWGWNGVSDVCPVYAYTEQYETQYPRGRVKLAKELVEGNIEPSSLMAEHVLECTLCGRCEELCPVDLPLHDILHALRTDIYAKGFTIPTHERIRKILLDHLNPYGPDRKKKDKPSDPRIGAQVLYYPGCSTVRKTSSEIAQVESILKALGVDYDIFWDDTCCGLPLHDTGMIEEMKTVAGKTRELIEKRKPAVVLTTCPGCQKAIEKLWKDVCGFETGFEVQGIEVFLGERLDLQEHPKGGRKVTWHDACELGRGMGIYELPRDIIRSLPGYELVEMREHHEKSACCGAGGGVMAGFKSATRGMGRDRINQAIEAGAEAIITSCPACYMNFSAALKKDDKLKVRFLSELVEESVAEGNSAEE